MAMELRLRAEPCTLGILVPLHCVSVRACVYATPSMDADLDARLDTPFSSIFGQETPSFRMGRNARLLFS